MSRATLTRLARLEASAPRPDLMVHVIPAHTDEEFQEKRAAFIDRHGVNASDTFVRVHKFTQTEPFATGRTITDLLAHVAMNGRRVHDYGRNAQ